MKDYKSSRWKQVYNSKEIRNLVLEPPSGSGFVGHADDFVVSFIYIYIYMCVCVCVLKNKYIYIYIYIYTYIYIYILKGIALQMNFNVVF